MHIDRKCDLMTEKEHRFIEKLYIENFDKLYHYANTVLQDSEASKDLVNDTFTDAVRKASQLTVHEKPVGWLIEALKRNIKSYKRNHAKKPQIIPLSDEEPLSETEMTEDNSEFLDYAPALSEEECRMLALYYEKGYSHKDLAEEFGISISASQKRLERIKQRVRQMLDEK